MALRSSWEGFLRFNLISVPVRAYSAATQARGKIGLHLLHRGCNQRIRYQKVCPVHGEVTKTDIVSGYEYSKGEYVVIEPGELERLRPGGDKVIDVATFLRPDSLDPVYFTERSYYLAPAGKVGQKSFGVLQRVMAEKDRYALASAVLSGREQLTLIRATGGLLVMTVLSYDDQIKKPSVLADEVPAVEPSAAEVELAGQLVEAATAEEFDYSQYHDTYTQKLRALIEAKAAGKQLVAGGTAEETPHVINLMDALKRSLREAKKERSGTGNGKKSARPRPAPRRRKTG